MTIHEKIEKAAKEARTDTAHSHFYNFGKADGITAGANLLLPDYERMREVLQSVYVDPHRWHMQTDTNAKLETIKDLL